MDADSIRTLVIRRSDDETFDLFLDGAFVISASFLEHGMGGMDGVVETAKKLGAAFGADVIEEDIR